MKVELRNRRDPAREEAELITQVQSISLRSQVVLDGYIRPTTKINRKSAEAAGEELYWPDEPCRRGHEYWRITHNGKCLACEHIRTISKRAMPLSGRRAWRSAEDRRLRSGEIQESECVQIFRPTMQDLSPELRALIDSRNEE